MSNCNFKKFSNEFLKKVKCEKVFKKYFDIKKCLSGVYLSPTKSLVGTVCGRKPDEQ